MTYLELNQPLMILKWTILSPSQIKCIFFLRLSWFVKSDATTLLTSLHVTYSDFVLYLEDYLIAGGCTGIDWVGHKLRGGSRKFERGVHKILRSRITVFRLWPLFLISCSCLPLKVCPPFRTIWRYSHNEAVFIVLVKNKMFEVLQCKILYKLINYYPACRLHKQFVLQKT